MTNSQKENFIWEHLNRVWKFVLKAFEEIHYIFQIYRTQQILEVRENSDKVGLTLDYSNANSEVDIASLISKFMYKIGENYKYSSNRVIRSLNKGAFIREYLKRDYSYEKSLIEDEADLIIHIDDDKQIIDMRDENNRVFVSTSYCQAITAVELRTIIYIFIRDVKEYFERSSK